MPRNTPKSAIKATGKVNNESSITRLETVLDQQRMIYNDSLTFLETQAETDPHTLKDTLRKRITRLRHDQPEYQKTLRLISLTTTQRAITSHLRHLAPKEGTKPSGKPRKKTAERFRTLILYSPANQIIHFTEKAGTTRLKIKGMPTIRLKPHQEIPRDQQPSTVEITLRGKQIKVRLIYDQTQSPKLKPIREIRNSLGMDIGVAITLALSNGNTYTSPREDKLNTQIKQTQKVLSQKIAAALREGRCAVQALLDENNHQVISKRGKPRSQTVWLKEPTKAYLKTRKTLTGLYERRNTLRHDFRHRVTTEIIKTALDQKVDLIAIEELQILNMTASARGNADAPGQNVQAKSGLNRSILRQGWGSLITMLNYKAERAGIRHVAVWPAHSSQTCSSCWAIDPKSRKGRKFTCISCGFTDDADLNASRVIAKRGLDFIRKILKQPPSEA